MQVTVSALKRSPRSLRDLLTQRWPLTEQTYERANAKRVYYLSMEFLIGRTLIHNIINMGVEQLVRDDLRSDPRQDWTEVIDSEPEETDKKRFAEWLRSASGQIVDPATIFDCQVKRIHEYKGNC